MATYALIDSTQTVRNIILLETPDTYTAPEGLTLTELSSLPTGVGIGSKNVDEAWIAPSAPENPS